MTKKTITNIGDPDQVKQAAKTVKVLDERTRNGIIKMVNDPDCLYVLESFLADARVFNDNFHPDPYENAFNGGFRSSGLWWLSKVMLHAPQFLTTMSTDNDSPMKAQ